MPEHDDACTAYRTDPADCPCQHWDIPRNDERATIEKRVRQSGIARHLASHHWDQLITAIRGTR